MTARIVIRNVADSPGIGLLNERLAGLTVKDNLSLDLIATFEDATRVGFYGSPTILIDGTDPFPVAGTSPGLSCRLFRTEPGTEPAPSLDQLREALTASP